MEEKPNMDVDYNDLCKVLKSWFEQDGEKLPEPPNAAKHPKEWKMFWVDMLAQKKKIIVARHEENMNKFSTLDFIVRTSSIDKIQTDAKQSKF